MASINKRKKTGCVACDGPSVSSSITLTTLGLSYTEDRYVTRRYVTREQDDDDPWDRDSTDASIDLHHLVLINDGSSGTCRESVTVGFPVQKGMRLYAVVAIYGDGDSFGSDGGRVEFIDAFPAPNGADLCAQAAREASGTYTYTNAIGIQVSQHAPWCGYFEWLQEVRVEQLRVQ